MTAWFSLTPSRGSATPGSRPKGTLIRLPAAIVERAVMTNRSCLTLTSDGVVQFAEIANASTPTSSLAQEDSEDRHEKLRKYWNDAEQFTSHVIWDQPAWCVKFGRVRVNVSFSKMSISGVKTRENPVISSAFSPEKKLSWVELVNEPTGGVL